MKIIGVSPSAPYCAEFELTNSGTEATTYTVSFAFTTSTGEVLANASHTALAVKPGRTVRDTVTPGELLGTGGREVRVKVNKVRSVPAAEAPIRGGTCPRSGTLLYADADPDAAMGLRDLGIHLHNCGKHPVHLNGYPQLQLLDEDHKPVPAVKILQDSGPPRPLTLKPGERASAHLVWRNTTEFGTALNLPYARLRAKPGTAPVMITPEFDLGTTGKLTVHPWKKDQP